jgi:16S rRNA (cytidine1402-2'-O)-methyltransferase
LNPTVRGRLYLVPVPLGDISPELVLAPPTLEIVRRIELVFAENAKSARAFLRAAAHPRPIASIEIHAIPDARDRGGLDSAMALIAGGRDAIIVSEAGTPGIADPGSVLVRAAHAAGVRVIPCIGPSAILLALAASGLNGQRFVFHGYLPVEEPALRKRLQELERQATHADATQAWIETPYRTDRMVTIALDVLAPATRLCVAADLTLATEEICSLSIAQWRRSPRAFGKRPAVFALGVDRALTH